MVLVNFELVKSSCTYFVELHVSSGVLCENTLNITNFYVVILNKLYYMRLILFNKKCHEFIILTTQELYLVVYWYLK